MRGLPSTSLPKPAVPSPSPSTRSGYWAAGTVTQMRKLRVCVLVLLSEGPTARAALRASPSPDCYSTPLLTLHTSPVPQGQMFPNPLSGGFYNFHQTSAQLFLLS